MKKISRRNFLLASGVSDHWCSSGSLRRFLRFHQHCCFFCGSRIQRSRFRHRLPPGQGAEHLVLER